MSEQITLTLPDDVAQQAELLARRTGRQVADLLTEAIELAFRPLGAAPGGDDPVTAWSDQQVFAATTAELPPADDQRLSELLDRQQAGAITDAERPELAALMELYQAGLFRKAQAWREAVRRGLREPPEP